MPHLHNMSQTMFALSGNAWLDLRERIHPGSCISSQLTSFTYSTMVIFSLTKPQTQRFEKIKCTRPGGLKPPLREGKKRTQTQLPMRE